MTQITHKIQQKSLFALLHTLSNRREAQKRIKDLGELDYIGWMEGNFIKACNDIAPMKEGGYLETMIRDISGTLRVPVMIDFQSRHYDRKPQTAAGGHDLLNATITYALETIATVAREYFFEKSLRDPVKLHSLECLKSGMDIDEFRTDFLRLDGSIHMLVIFDTQDNSIRTMVNTEKLSDLYTGVTGYDNPRVDDRFPRSLLQTSVF